MTEFHASERAGWSAEGHAERYAGLVARVTGRIVEPLLDAAQVHGGTRVLDVGSGTGALVAAASSRDADAVGVDVSPDMVRYARERNPHLRFEVAEAESLPFDDDSFDAAVTAFVLQHVSVPERVVLELGRVARHVAVAQWDVAARARLLGVLTDAIAAAGVPPAGTTGPSRERLARDEELERLLRGAHLEDVRVQTVAFEQPVAGADELWAGVLSASVNIAATLKAQDVATRAQIRAEFDRIVAAYETGDGLAIPVSVKIASGMRS